MPEVVLERLLDIGWVTIGYTTLLPNHLIIIIRTFGRHILTQGIIFSPKIGSPDTSPSMAMLDI